MTNHIKYLFYCRDIHDFYYQRNNSPLILTNGKSGSITNVIRKAREQLAARLQAVQTQV